MPYIKPEERALIDPLIVDLLAKVPLMSAGEVNYTITRIIKTFSAPKYVNIALSVGILENVKQEFYRRYAAPYEDVKIVENGDVY